MKKTEIRKQVVLDKIADHLLEQGLKQSSLRKLARVVGTSDRMLLYYFSDKEEMMSAALNVISERLVRILENTQAEPMSFQILLPHLARTMKSPLIHPYLKIWLELASLAAGGEEFYRTIARQIYDSFFYWIASVLKVEKEENRKPMAALALATVEGFVLLDAIEYDSQISFALEGIANQHMQAPQSLHLKLSPEVL